MMVHESELPAAFDIDETLILKSGTPKPGYDLVVDYFGTPKYIKPINQHVEFLKACSARGYEVTVWSANGWKWAANVIYALGLVEFVNHIETKPLFYCDDKPADSWSKQVYIKESD